ncbi:MAG: response regulator transcription factor, partial [Chitinophagaceae bacterium]
MKNKQPIKVALADDHVLLRNALASLIDGFENCKVICQFSDGSELLNFVQKESPPDVVLLDLNMPTMDGYDTAIWFKKNKPDINILMLTMYDSELLLIRLLQAGVRGFLKKDIHPGELELAIETVMKSGYYSSNYTSGKLANLFRLGKEDNPLLEKAMLNKQELQFLHLACSEMTYKEIALEMKLNPRGVDSLRDHLFDKLDVKSRVGLALFAIKNGVVTL